MRFIRWLSVALAALAWPAAAHAQLTVCATVPDLGSMAREVGGGDVGVMVFARGVEDPHFLVAKPSFVRDLSRADLLLHVGMGLEEGWLPPVLNNSRNARVLADAPGNLNCSKVIKPMEVPIGVIDRSQGDVHAEGNPHYLLDPLNGLKVARLIRDQLVKLRPDSAEGFKKRYDDLARRMAVKMIGDKLLKKYTVEDMEKMALLHEYGRLGKYLKEQNEMDQLGGWLGELLPHYATKVVDDHSLFPYFARRFGLVVVGHLEPKPGVPPTTAHLQTLSQQMQKDNVRIILASPYFNPRHASAVASSTGASVVNIAHQVGARGGTEDYLNMVDYNVKQLVAVLQPKRSKK